MNRKKDDVEKIGFFKKMQTSEHKGFEISMFTISIVLSLAVVISAIWIGTYFYKANGTKITDDEANAGSVTESAVVADEDEDEEPVNTPSGNVVVTDTEDDEDIDPDLKDAKVAYTTAVVNLRSAASLTASVIMKVPMGEKVKLVKVTDDNWVEVTYESQSGYIHARYLSTTKIEPLATIKPTETPQARATQTPTAQPTATPTAKPTKKPAKATATPKKTKKPVTEEPEITEEPDVTTPEPTVEVTAKPTQKPTVAPTKEPTLQPEITAVPEGQGASE